MTSTTTPELMGCDLEQSKVTWNGSYQSDQRSDLDNLFSDDSNAFLSLGTGKKVTLGLRENNVPAACPVEGKTLKFDEITWGGMGYEQWAEQGLLRLRVTGCKDIEDGWMVYEPNGNQRFFKTADTVNVDFDAWLGGGHGCQLGAI